ncbi:MAG: exo-alpha-sialidase [Planctomycetota bacterium]|nr:exo-alpha-sialidase [Planctomycetota bacterium]
MGMLVIVGTDKGAFLLRSDTARAHWKIQGPLFKGWKVTTVARDDSGRYFVATASDVYGQALHVSEDLDHWRQIENGPAWAKDTERKLNQIWTLNLQTSRFYAGVDEAGLFGSEDRGESWSPIEGLNEHPTRDSWYPGAGGLCAHAVLTDAKNPKRIWCGISAVGVFRSDDGGLTWEIKNQGIPMVIEDKQHHEIGRCVHGLVADPDDANTIYRREHNGMFRTRDGGETWQRIENGLDSSFGFPIVIDRTSKTLYIIPLESDEYRIPIDGRFRVYRSANGGDTWDPLSNGLPQENAYMGVLRDALAVDHLDPCGVYVGTTAGTVHVSNDAGDSWTQVSCILPRILSVSVYVQE